MSAQSAADHPEQDRQLLEDFEQFIKSGKIPVTLHHNVSVKISKSDDSDSAYRTILGKLAEAINGSKFQSMESFFIFMPEILSRYVMESYNPEVQNIMSAQNFLWSVNRHCNEIIKGLAENTSYAKPGSPSIFNYVGCENFKNQSEFMIPPPLAEHVDKKTLDYENQGNFIAMFLLLINEYSVSSVQLQKGSLDLIETICTAGFTEYDNRNLLRVKFTNKLYLEILTALIRTIKTEYSQKTMRCFTLMNNIARSTFDTYGLLISRVGQKILSNLMESKSSPDLYKESKKLAAQGSRLKDLKNDLENQDEKPDSPAVDDQGEVIFEDE